MDKRLLSLTFVFAILAAGLGAGFIIGKSTTLGQGASDIREFTDIAKIFSKKPSLDLLEEGINIIDAKYADRDDINKDDLFYGAMSGMLAALNDPYSVFLKPQATKIFQEDVEGTFEGIGAEIGIRDETLTVISPLKDNPAEKAGLKAGDKILYVDGVGTADLSLDEAVQIIRGKKGSTVVLTVSREDFEDSFEIAIIRDTIKIPIIEWSKEEGDIALIDFSHFTETASADFENIAHEILQSDTKKIILDLRNNPGGFLEVAVDIAGWFMKSDEIVLIEERRRESNSKTYRTSGSAALSDFPLVVLINRGSASAAEILAGALRDNRGIRLIGDTTFGKGSVQELINLSDGSSIKITIAKWLTPKGASIQDNGLEPDIGVAMTQEIFDADGDVQLQKAIEIVKNL